MKESEMESTEKKAIEDVDFFSKFMFGDRANSTANMIRDAEQKEDKDEDEDEDEDEDDEMHLTLHEEKDVSIEEKGRDWLFGSPSHRRPAHSGTNRQVPDLFNLGGANQKNPNNQTLFDILQHIDYTELMIHLDNLMSSASKLKPIFNKVKPYINTFLSNK